MLVARIRVYTCRTRKTPVIRSTCLIAIPSANPAIIIFSFSRFSIFGITLTRPIITVLQKLDNVKCFCITENIFLRGTD